MTVNRLHEVGLLSPVTSSTVLKLHYNLNLIHSRNRPLPEDIKVNLYVLGAGKPYKGKQPSALKSVTEELTALDWHLSVFKDDLQSGRTYFAGGYHFEDVVKAYPELEFTVIPDWKTKTALHSFLSMPLTPEPAFLVYADTIYRSGVSSHFNSKTADVLVGVDTLWQTRFVGRPDQDVEKAEILSMEDGSKAEFAGIVKFSPSAMQTLLEVNEAQIGESILDLIDWMKKSALSVEFVDLLGQWAEFNLPNDVVKFVMGTKAETLARLMPMVEKSQIGEQLTFTVDDWVDEKSLITTSIAKQFLNKNVIVRSSSGDEDGWEHSNAGGFETVGNIPSNDPDAVKEAIETVVSSYGETAKGHHQVLIQEFLENVDSAGVIFTCGLETGAPYYCINFDDKSNSTSSVTDGTAQALRTILVNRQNRESLRRVESKLIPLLEATQEIEKLLGFNKLDIEFAYANDGTVHILQIRPITVDHGDFEIKPSALQKTLNKSKSYFLASQAAGPTVSGGNTVFANMPDWNPAEIIGSRPKPLALSLYQNLIANEVWATQRSEFGYQDIRPYPLLCAYAGQPYVDVRASLNSFIPAGLPKDVIHRIANAYLAIFELNPQFHDKIEFEVVFTLWTPDFEKLARDRMGKYGVTDIDIALLGEGLKALTRQALDRLPDDIASIQTLKTRRNAIKVSSQSDLNKTYDLLYDCRTFGTLAFAHAARAGFVAKALLNHLASAGVFSPDRSNQFMKSIHTVATEFDLRKRSVAAGDIEMRTLIEEYGHLRPGTYDITIPAYWEDPEFYIDTSGLSNEPVKQDFKLADDEAVGVEHFLKQLGVEKTPDDLMDYMRMAIVAREAVKFDFTKNLSLALDHILNFFSDMGLSRDDIAFLTYADIEACKLAGASLKALKSSVKRRRRDYLITRLIELPSVILSELDFECFERMSTLPNFVTTGRVAADTVLIGANEKQDLMGKIVLIPQADPGYDWLFGSNIAGLITKYGGANSHMAIRAAELGLPAAIGVGDKTFEHIQSLARVELDCLGQTIRAF